MKHYRISYTINARNERVYPAAIKGAVFTMTQDHPSEHLMVAATETALAEDGSSIVAMTAAEAEALAKQFRDGLPRAAPQLPMPMPAPPRRAP